jgi:hypothetical protein
MNCKKITLKILINLMKFKIFSLCFRFPQGGGFGPDPGVILVDVAAPEGNRRHRRIEGEERGFFFKGQCHEIFRLLIISSNNFSWPQ